MRELLQTIPDVEVLLVLEPEELGAKLLFLIRQRFRPPQMYHIVFFNELWDIHNIGAGYPAARKPEVYRAYREAVSWLEAQGLLIPAEGTNGANGYRVLARRAERFTDETDFRRYSIAR